MLLSKFEKIFKFQVQNKERKKTLKLTLKYKLRIITFKNRNH